MACLPARPSSPCSNTDVLMGLLKKVRRKRPDLRIIISSATADAEAFRCVRAYHHTTHHMRRMTQHIT
jgi:hypothetical protein